MIEKLGGNTRGGTGKISSLRESRLAKKAVSHCCLALPATFVMLGGEFQSTG